MAQRKRKVVFTAEPEQLAQIEELVQTGRYRTASAFLREAIDEKLEALQKTQLLEEVERYCAAGYAEEDSGLIDVQAFEKEL